MSESTATVKTIYAIRDTAAGQDIAVGVFGYTGEAVAWLASYVVALKRISFDVYRLGDIDAVGDELIMSSSNRQYVCSASQAILDSHVEDVDKLLDMDSLDD